MKQKTSVYLLTAINPRIHQDCKKGHYLKDQNNSFKCWAEKIGVFSSIDKAEEAINVLVKNKEECNKKWKSWDTYFGFILTEHYIDDVFDKNENVSSFESCRSYLSNGKLNCASECDERCEKKFFGTSCPNIHVKKGDIALELNGETHLTPVLVEETSFTKEEWKERFKPGVYGDFTDDSGLAFSAYHGHVHPFAPMLFPISCLPYATILRSDIKKMEKERKTYYDED